MLLLNGTVAMIYLAGSETLSIFSCRNMLGVMVARANVVRPCFEGVLRLVCICISRRVGVSSRRPTCWAFSSRSRLRNPYDLRRMDVRVTAILEMLLLLHELV